jgi:hypothetical protein
VARGLVAAGSSSSGQARQLERQQWQQRLLLLPVFSLAVSQATGMTA